MVQHSLTIIKLQVVGVGIDLWHVQAGGLHWISFLLC